VTSPVSGSAVVLVVVFADVDAVGSIVVTSADVVALLVVDEIELVPDSPDDPPPLGSGSPQPTRSTQ